MTWLKVLLISVCLLTAFQPSLAMLECLDTERGTTEEQSDERVSASEQATPAAHKRRGRSESPARRLIARLSATRRIVRAPAPAGLAAFRPAVPVPLIC